MAKVEYDFEAWVEGNEWTEADLEKAYKKVKFRRNLYGILTFLTPVGILFAPFWYKALYLTKSFKYRNLDVEPCGLAKLLFGIYVICSLFIYPIIMLKIITKTNWGMGINKL